MPLEWIQTRNDDVIYGILRGYRVTENMYKYRVNYLESMEDGVKHYSGFILGGNSCGYIGAGEPCVVESRADGRLQMLLYDTDDNIFDNGKRYNIYHARDYKEEVKVSQISDDLSQENRGFVQALATDVPMRCMLADGGAAENTSAQ